MNNTIILKYSEVRLTKEEFKNFKKGNTICGGNNYPVEELKRWSFPHVIDLDDIEESTKELNKCRCSYKEDGSLYNVEEYALEYCECDENGEFVQGSDYEFAMEE